MAYTEEKFFTRGTKFGKDWRISILEDGGAGAGDRITAKDEFFTKRYPMSSPREFWSRRIIEPILEVTIRFDPDTDLSFYKGIAQAPDDTYRLRFQYDGSIDVIGSIKGGIVTINERAAPKTVTLRAKPLTVLKANDFPLEVARDPTVIVRSIGDIVNQTGFDLPIYTYNDWAANELPDTDDYMWEAAIDQYHFRDYAGNKSEDTPFTYYEALESVIPDGHIFFMADGAWHLLSVPYVAKQEGASVQRYQYTWDGSQYIQGTSGTVNLRETFTSGNYLLRHASDSDYHEGIKKLVQEYNHKTLISSLSFEPSYVHSTSGATSTESMEFSSDGSARVKITGDVLMDIVETGGTANGQAQFYIKAGSYYWNEDTGNWDNSAPIPYIDVNVFGLADELLEGSINLTTSAIPSAASGDLEVQFEWGTASREDGTSLTVNEIEWNGFDLDIINASQEANSAGITYELTQTQQYSLELSLPDRIFGQGPTDYSRGRITDNVDGTLLDNWGFKGGTLNQDYADFIMSQIMSTQRNGIRVINAELWTEYNVGDVVEYESEYFLVLGGDFNGKQQRWNAYLYQLDYNTGTDTLNEIFDTDSSGQSAAIDGSSKGANIISSTFVSNQKITKTTAELSGTVTSVPIESVGLEFVTEGDTFYVYDIKDASLTPFVLNDAQLPGDTSLTVDSKDISPNVIPIGSWIIFTGDKISSYITKSDEAIRFGLFSDWEHVESTNGEAITSTNGEELLGTDNNQVALDQNYSSEIALLKGQIVLKATYDGRIASVDINSRPEEGSEITLNADQINLDSLITRINSEAVEISADKVSINNIVFDEDGGTIGSSNFSAGSAGWQIDGQGNAEFNDVDVRGANIDNSDLLSLTIAGSLVMGTSGNITNASGDYLTDADGYSVKTDSSWNTTRAFTVVDSSSGSDVGGVRGNTSAVFLEGRNGATVVLDGNKINNSGVVRYAHSTRTISSGVLNIDFATGANSFVTVFNEGGTATDDLVTLQIDGDASPEAGTVVYLEANTNASDQVVIKDGTGNINTGIGDVTLGDASGSEVAMLIYSSNVSAWKLINHSV